MYFARYRSELIGNLILVADDGALYGCWFEEGRFFGYGLEAGPRRPEEVICWDELAESGQDASLLQKEPSILRETRAWLDAYFAGEHPDPRELPLAQNLSPFKLLVREAMLDIPYGQVATYGEIAAQVSKTTGKKPCPQAAGGAVGHNPLCIIVPCHRVMGAQGKLTGFGGGLDMKVKLLVHEGVDTSRFLWP